VNVLSFLHVVVVYSDELLSARSQEAITARNLSLNDLRAYGIHSESHSMDNTVREYKDRFRIFLILYSFAEPNHNAGYADCLKVFKSEVKIQKIDFLLRNPDYLAYELLSLAKIKQADPTEVKQAIKSIYMDREPELRRLHMEKFFFGAYEDIDNVIAFLVAVGFIKFVSNVNASLKVIDKEYYITEKGCNRAEQYQVEESPLLWYYSRCELIKKYFGAFTGTQLKVLQYQVSEYHNTAYKKYIADVSQSVRNDFYEYYSEVL